MEEILVPSKRQLNITTAENNGQQDYSCCPSVFTVVLPGSFEYGKTETPRVHLFPRICEDWPFPARRAEDCGRMKSYLLFIFFKGDVRLDDAWTEKCFCGKCVLVLDDGGTGDGLFSIIRLAFMPMFVLGCLAAILCSLTVHLHLNRSQWWWGLPHPKEPGKDVSCCPPRTGGRFPRNCRLHQRQARRKPLCLPSDGPARRKSGPPCGLVPQPSCGLCCGRS